MGRTDIYCPFFLEAEPGWEAGLVISCLLISSSALASLITQKKMLCTHFHVKQKDEGR